MHDSEPRSLDHSNAVSTALVLGAIFVLAAFLTPDSSPAIRRIKSRPEVSSGVPCAETD